MRRQGIGDAINWFIEQPLTINLHSQAPHANAYRGLVVYIGSHFSEHRPAIVRKFLQRRATLTATGGRLAGDAEDDRSRSSMTTNPRVWGVVERPLPCYELYLQQSC